MITFCPINLIHIKIPSSQKNKYLLPFLRLSNWVHQLFGKQKGYRFFTTDSLLIDLFFFHILDSFICIWHKVKIHISWSFWLSYHDKICSISIFPVIPKPLLTSEISTNHKSYTGFQYQAVLPYQQSHIQLS